MGTAILIPDDAGDDELREIAAEQHEISKPKPKIPPRMSEQPLYWPARRIDSELSRRIESGL